MTTAPGPDPEPELDPTLADLAEEVTRRLLAGERGAAEACVARNPGSAGPLRALLPTLHGLVGLGRSVARGRGNVPRPIPPRTPSPEDFDP